jgi:hypothetical protein
MIDKYEKKTEELEETLAAQLEMLRKESGEWLKVGAAVAVGALVVYGIFKATGKKKDHTTDRAMAVLEKEGLLDDDIKERLTTQKKSTFWPNLTQRLLILGLALGKEKLAEMFTPPTDVTTVEEDI